MEFSPSDVAKIARAVIGDENKKLSTKSELRFGTNGSLSVDLKKGVWASHEDGDGGGMVRLVEAYRGLKGSAAVNFIRELGVELPERDPPVNGARRHEPAARENTSKGEIVARYPYVDESGNLLFEVCRIEDGSTTSDGKRRKTFRQRVRDESAPGGWRWSVEGIRQVPYRLPDVLERVAEGFTIFIAEGEKAVDALWKIGVPATCNAGGAGKWPDELCSHFRDAEVVILPDDDPQSVDQKTGQPKVNEDGSPKRPGMDHARMVAAKLAGVAKIVRVLELTQRRKKEDAFDWIEQGGDAEKLFDLVEARARAWPFPPEFVSRYNAMPWQDIGRGKIKHEWLIKGLLTRRERSVVVGAPGSGKTFAVLDMAMSVVRGIPYYGRTTRKGGVIYQAGEGSAGVIKRVEAYRQHHELSPSADVPFVLIPAEIDLYSSDDQTAAFIAECRHWASTFADPLELVVIDTLSSATPGANENDSGDVSRVLARCARIARELNCAVMIVHHLNASGARERGHSSIRGNVDSMIRIEELEGHKDERGLTIKAATLVKAKDEASNMRWRFVLPQVVIGLDEEGDKITSCVVVPVNEAENAGEARGAYTFKSQNSSFLFRLLFELIRAKGRLAPAEVRAPPHTYVVTADEWREEFRRRMPDKSEKETDAQWKDRTRKTISRALQLFQNLRLIGVDGDHVWLTGRPVTGFPSRQNDDAGSDGPALDEDVSDLPF